MTAFNHNSNRVDGKRVPFSDKTNLIYRHPLITTKFNNSVFEKSSLEAFAKTDPKFKLLSKVHLQSGIIINKNRSNTTHLQSTKASIKKIISNDPKFRLIPKVHLQRLNIKDKFRLISKVHLKRLNIKDKMPPSTKALKNGVVGKISKISNQKCVGNSEDKFIPNGGNSKIKATKLAPKELSVLDNSNPKKTIIPSGPKFKEPIVQVMSCKQLETALKRNKSQEIIKKVQFTHDLNSTPKFDKALRKRKTKNYAETSFNDTSSPKQNLEQNHTEHVPIYQQNTAIEQKQTKQDPFEFLSESFSDNTKTKRRKGRPFKKIKSPLQSEKLRKRGRPFKEPQELTDSDSSLYDKSMHDVLKKIRLKVSAKRYKHVRRINVKQNNKVKVVTNQIKNKQLQIAPSNDNTRKINLDKPKNGLVVSNVKVTAGPDNMQKRVTDTRKQNLNEILNKNPNGLVSSGKNKTRPLQDVHNGPTLKLLSNEVQTASRRISRLSSLNIENEPKTDDVDTYFGFDDDYEDDFNDISRVLSPKRVSNGTTMLHNIKPITARFTSLTSTPIPNSLTRNPKITEAKRINILSNILVSPSTRQKKLDVLKSSTIRKTSTIDTSNISSLIENEPDAFLGFENSHVIGPSTSKVDKNCTTSNQDFTGARLHPSIIPEKDFHGFIKINNQSNINTNRRQNRSRTSHPWRGDRLQVKRNPYFLTIKDTSLPCYNQEMILGPEILERPKTPIPTSRKTRSNKVQNSILDFVSSNRISNESTPTKKNHNMSLFDDADFSPIRDNDVQENSSPKNSKNKLETPKSKRNIFGVLKNKNQTSPLRERNREEVFGVENYFGFDSPVHNLIAGKENIRITRKRAKINEEARPMRVPMQQVKKIREEAVEELFDEIDLEDIAKEPDGREIEDALPNEKSQDEDLPHVGLFEDLAEVKPSPRIYERKRAKRTRARSVSTDTKEVVAKPTRKRKDVLTLAEEEEFNKWAKEFNAMCNEIEKHDLTLA